MRNYSEIKTEVAKLVQRSDDSSYVADIGTWVNMIVEYAYNIYDYWPELQDIYSFTSVDGRMNYQMPNVFDKPFRVYDITNDRLITPFTEETYRDGNMQAVNDLTEGVPDTYRLFGVSGITGNMPTAGSIIKVKSSSASDTSVVVRVEGYIDSAKTILDFENITVTGTSYVSGTKTFYKVTHLSKAADSIGYFTVVDSSDNVLNYLSSLDRVMRHRIMRLGPVPDASTYSYEILFKRRFTKLVNDNDYPFIAADDYIILGAAGYALSQSKEQSGIAESFISKSKDSLSVLLTNVQNSLGPDFQHKMGTTWDSAHRRSR